MVFLLTLHENLQASLLGHCRSRSSATGSTLSGSGNSNIGAYAVDGGFININSSALSHFLNAAKTFNHGYINGGYVILSSNGFDFYALWNGVIFIDGTNNATMYADAGTGSYID